MVERSEEADGLVAALTGLRAALAGLRLPLGLPQAQTARGEVTRLTDHLDDYLLPRLRQMGAPLLAVVGGSTGAGKSTLVNSLVGEQVTTPGVLRPTTRSPVLVHHPDDVAWFSSDRVLPGLSRVTGASGRESDDARSLRLVPHSRVPRGLALLDAPDIDSVVVANRELGEELLGAADLWVFVTTGARYADAVPWDLLRGAARRRAAVAMVLNRVDPTAQKAVTAHLGTMLTEQGLAGARLYTVPETRLAEGRLPQASLGELRQWLDDLAGDAATRRAVVRQAVAGAVQDVVLRSPPLAAAGDEQIAHAEHLHATVTAAYGRAHEALAAATSDGTMLRGEVLARWQEFVGTGELLRAIETRVSTWRDRATAFLRGRPAPEPVTEAIGSGLVELVVDAADRAAQASYAAWHADAAGAYLLDGLRLSRSAPDLRDRVAEQVRAWQGGVLDLVATEGVDRRLTARVLSFGVNGLGAALMVTIFASTGGLTAAEVGVAGGTAVLAQRLLEAVFGDDAVRRLTRTAQEDLDRRLGRLLDEEAARFTAVLDALDLPRNAARDLRAATAQVAQASVWLGGPEGADGRGGADDGARGSTPADGGPGQEAVSAGRGGPSERREPFGWWRRLWRS